MGAGQGRPAPPGQGIGIGEGDTLILAVCTALEKSKDSLIQQYQEGYEWLEEANGGGEAHQSGTYRPIARQTESSYPGNRVRKSIYAEPELNCLPPQRSINRFDPNQQWLLIRSMIII